MSPNKKTSIVAVGDISFAGKLNIQPSDEVFAEIKSQWRESEIVVANLESPLLSEGVAIQGKCVLRAEPGWTTVLKRAGIKIVSLANNHMMDYGPEGFFNTINFLQQDGINYVGAGRDQLEANSPFYLSSNGQQIAFLARSAVVVSSPLYAGQNSPGVASFDIKEIRNTIRICKKQADTIVLLLHWGLEHYLYPSPSQRKTAIELINLGVDLIIGHHPHVLQGVEKYNNSLICYSLGNFVFDNVKWSFLGDDGQQHEKIVKLKHQNREGGILRVELLPSGISSFQFIQTYITSNGIVRLDNTINRKRRFSRMCSRLKFTAYDLIWRLYSIKQELYLRVIPHLNGKMSWEKIKRVRLQHFIKMLNIIKRSTKITSEKSTNPYE